MTALRTSNNRSINMIAKAPEHRPESMQAIIDRLDAISVFDK